MNCSRPSAHWRRAQKPVKAQGSPGCPENLRLKVSQASVLVLVLLAGCGSDIENHPAHERHFRAPASTHASAYTSAFQSHQKASHHEPHRHIHALAPSPYSGHQEGHAAASHTRRSGV
jgi:hypothetical protein